MKTRMALLAFGAAMCVHSDTGVLIPGDRQAPDPAFFTLNEMAIEIRIDNSTARVQVRQIFGNKTGAIQEGKYTFALPSSASISDFAVWDDVNRIPGVILERRRAGEIYEQAKSQAIDPGLLQMGERDADEARRSPFFSAKIVPIPAFGTKRVEMEYQQRIAVDRYQSEFVVSLKPDVYGLQTAGHLTITFELHSEHAIRDFNAIAKTYPLQVKERTPNSVKAVFFGDNVPLREDFVVRYAFDAAQADALKIITEREDAGEPGFFEAQTLLRTNSHQDEHAPRTVIVLFDNSLSMQWDKLERSFAACETSLRRLRPADLFNLGLFNSEVGLWADKPRPATTANVESALAFIRNSRIRGGTDIRRALQTALAQSDAGAGEHYIVLISDGGATEGTVQNGRLGAWFANECRKKATAARPHTFVFGVGDDANLPLLKMLASNNGLLEWVRSTEPIDFKLNAFLDKIGTEPVKNLALSTSPASNFEMVYPLEDARFAGSVASWVGRYKKPMQQASFTVQGVREGQALRTSQAAALPAAALEHPYLPRTWAKARVDALLEKIERDGEDRATIDEIIRLSKKYKFVTPYTSFLAAPRSLLRPRVIRPGDPVLRVKTDESISSVIALFPFGLVKPLRYMKAEDAWQTRFLAPLDMADGTYQVRLILRDRFGHVYRESKTFVIASKTPVLRARVDKPRIRAGEKLRLIADASANTRTITARLYGTMPVALRWNDGAKASTADIVVPADLPAGKYTIHVTAEDIAHNVGTQEVPLEIW